MCLFWYTSFTGVFFPSSPSHLHSAAPQACCAAGRSTHTLVWGTSSSSMKVRCFPVALGSLLPPFATHPSVPSDLFLYLSSFCHTILFCSIFCCSPQFFISISFHRSFSCIVYKLLALHVIAFVLPIFNLFTFSPLVGYLQWFQPWVGEHSEVGLTHHFLFFVKKKQITKMGVTVGPTPNLPPGGSGVHRCLSARARYFKTVSKASENVRWCLFFPSGAPRGGVAPSQETLFLFGLAQSSGFLRLAPQGSHGSSGCLWPPARCLRTATVHTTMMTWWGKAGGQRCGRASYVALSYASTFICTEMHICKNINKWIPPINTFCLLQSLWRYLFGPNPPAKLFMLCPNSHLWTDWLWKLIWKPNALFIDL